jgi:hypothetical protein
LGLTTFIGLHLELIGYGRGIVDGGFCFWDGVFFVDDVSIDSNFEWLGICIDL